MFVLSNVSFFLAGMLVIVPNVASTNVQPQYSEVLIAMHVQYIGTYLCRYIISCICAWLLHFLKLLTKTIPHMQLYSLSLYLFQLERALCATYSCSKHHYHGYYKDRTTWFFGTTGVYTSLLLVLAFGFWIYIKVKKIKVCIVSYTLLHHFIRPILKQQIPHHISLKNREVIPQEL